MKSNRMAIIGLAVLIVILLVGVAILWLANAPIMPPVKAVNQAIPDDHIPR
jgi:hypothetical protein